MLTSRNSKAAARTPFMGRHTGPGTHKPIIKLQGLPSVQHEPTPQHIQPDPSPQIPLITQQVPQQEHQDNKLPKEHERLGNPKVFGPGKWDDLHTYAIAATTPEDKRAFCRFVRIITSSLKCLQCREHATRYVREHPPEEYLNVKDAKGRDAGLFVWVCLFHNTVNRRLNLPEVDYEVSYSLYEPDSMVCVKDCGSPETAITPSGAEIITAQLNKSLVSYSEPSAGAFTMQNEADAPTGVTAVPAPVYSYSVLGRNPIPGKKPDTEVTYIPTYVRAKSPSPPRARANNRIRGRT